MKIVKPGKYPEDNRCVCESCKCEFLYYDMEVHTDMTTPDEVSMFGGFGVHQYVECPECKTRNTINYTFTEERDFIDSIIDWFKSIVNKIIKKEEK